MTEQAISLTLADSLRVIRADGKVVEQQPWDMLWFAYYDSYPGDRHMFPDMTSAQVIELAEAILTDRCNKQKES